MLKFTGSEIVIILYGNMQQKLTCHNIQNIFNVLCKEYSKYENVYFHFMDRTDRDIKQCDIYIIDNKLSGDESKELHNSMKLYIEYIERILQNENDNETVDFINDIISCCLLSDTDLSDQCERINPGFLNYVEESYIEVSELKNLCLTYN